MMGMFQKKATTEAVLSETDRDRLKGMDVSLSMSVREKAFIQRFYLYLIMTKTSEKLYITYARNGMDMKAVLPSYIIRMIKKMFPLVKEYAREDTFAEHAYIRIPKADIVWSEGNLNKCLQRELHLNYMEGSLQEA